MDAERRKYIKTELRRRSDMRKRNKMPEIKGFTKLAEAGIGENGEKIFAPAVFLAGCNLRCPYCMNARLVKGAIEGKIDIRDIENYIRDQDIKMLLISGGEPTLTNIERLENFIYRIKKLDCEVGMSTNGMLPFVLEEIIGDLNYVALDFKSPPMIYRHLLPSINKLEAIKPEEKIIKSLGIVQKKRDDYSYEIRTTLYPPMVRKEDIPTMAEYLNKDSRWVFQVFRAARTMMDSGAKNIVQYTDDEINDILEYAKTFVSKVNLRYV